MSRLTNLIKEVLSTQPKKKDCNCGCNTCDNVDNEGILLNESKAPKMILSENLQYHVHNKLPLTENTFRYGSESFLNLWQEARYLYLREIIHVNDDDKEILEETNLGNYGIYEGKKVPLDLPMLNENIEPEILQKEFEKEFNVRTSLIGNQKLVIFDKGGLYEFDDMAEFIESKGFKVDANFSSLEYEIDDDRARYPFIIFSKELFNEGMSKSAIKDAIKIIDKQIDTETGGDGEPLTDETLQALEQERERLENMLGSLNEDENNLDIYYRPGFKDFTGLVTKIAKEKNIEEKRKLMHVYVNILPKATKEKKYKLKQSINKMNSDQIDVFAYNLLMRDSKMTSLEEAEFKGKKVKLNKPKRGGSKKFYVYVKDGDKVKKVSFGDTTGLKAKINDPVARRAFSKRHDCPNKKDKTKASYWSCRLPRYAKLLGLKSSFSGFW